MDDSGMYGSQRLPKSKPSQPSQSQSQYDIHVSIGLPISVGASPKGSVWLPLHSPPKPAAAFRAPTLQAFLCHVRKELIFSWSADKNAYIVGH